MSNSSSRTFFNVAQAGQGAAQAGHEVAEGEALSDVFLGVFLASGIDDEDLFLDEAGGEGDVGGDGEVAGSGVVGDVSVGDVGAAFDADGVDEGIAGGS